MFNPKTKLFDLFLDTLNNLMYTYQEIWDRVVRQKPQAGFRKTMKMVMLNLRGPFFWVNLRESEMLVDFSKVQHGIDCAFVSVRKGQHQLERKVVKLGRNPKTSWLVLLNTTIGARESWWRKRNANGELSLKMDADI